ncbi:MAG TPA: hypothetical protein DCP91_11730 [Eggerthellaceae bacterium]|nr:hypothetical protein [Eggerthellaceae bacterium]
MGGMGGGMENADENCKLTINGGTITLQVGGDGLDTNGYLYLNGGEVYVSGPTNSGNGSMDYALGATVTGGTLVTAGAAGMAQGFSDGTQAFAIVSANGQAGDTITVQDANGAELASFTPTTAFQSIVVTAPGMADGQAYKLLVNGQATEFTASTQATAGAGQGMGGKGVGMGMGGQGGRDMGSRGPRGINGQGVQSQDAQGTTSTGAQDSQSAQSAAIQNA